MFSDPCFPVFGQSTGKYGPEKTAYWDTFHAAGCIKREFWPEMS